MSNKHTLPFTAKEIEERLQAVQTLSESVNTINEKLEGIDTLLDAINGEVV